MTCSTFKVAVCCSNAHFAGEPNSLRLFAPCDASLGRLAALERPFQRVQQVEGHNSPSKGHTGSGCVHVGLANRYDPNSPNNAFASFRSRVSKPSVNQP